jgi:AcrR family transcriptional regulator
MPNKDAIVTAACDTLARVGVSGVTVARVATRAKVSSALVHYHFATKRRLLAAAAQALARRRTEGRVTALASARGLAGLDAIWESLERGGPGGAERVWADLVVVSRHDEAVRAVLAAERADEQRRLGPMVASFLETLGARPRLTPEELAAAVGTYCDGASLALAGGSAPDGVRASFDAFWLALVALGQGAA